MTGTFSTSETEPQRLLSLSVGIFLRTEEFHTLGCHASVSQQKVFWKIKPFPACPGAKNRVSQGDPSIFRAPTSVFLTGSPSSCGVGGVYRVGLAMAIGTAVVVMAIEAVLDIVTVLVVQTVMAIVTVLASKPT